MHISMQWVRCLYLGHMHYFKLRLLYGLLAIADTILWANIPIIHNGGTT